MTDDYVSFLYKPTLRKALIHTNLLEEIREHFSVSNDPAKFVKGKPWIPTRKYAITPTGRFDIGMYYEIRKFLNDSKIKASVTHSDEFLKVLKPTIKADVPNNLKYEMRYYQEELVTRCLKYGRGIGKVGTGGGKTLIMANLIESIYASFKDKETYKCLVTVPNLSLVTQTYDAFEEYGCNFSFSKWTGKEHLDLATNVIICNASVLQARYKDNDWINYVDTLITDEVHSIKRDAQTTKIIDKILTPNKFGFTGTLPDKIEDRWNVLGMYGPVLYEKKSHELRDEGFLTNCSCQILRMLYKKGPEPVPNYVIKNGKKKKDKTAAYRNEVKFLGTHKFRNNVIKKICKGFDRNSLVLVNKIEHGEALFELLNEIEGKEVYFIRGSVEVEEREEVKKLMEEKQGITCIAMSQIFATGIDVKNIHMVILGDGGKSSVRIIQSIGRGLRKHASKDKLYLVDLQDQLEYGHKHGVKRKEIYKKEQIQFYEKNIMEP